MPPSTRLLADGEAVEGYRVVRELARGKFHAVYDAMDERSGVHVALKAVAVPTGARARADEVLSDLADAKNARHVSLLHLHRGGIHGRDGEEVAWIATELCTDGSLSDLVSKHGNLDAQTAARFIWQVAGALHTLHDQGVIHAAVSPGNVMVGAHGRVALSEPVGCRLHRALHGPSSARRPEAMLYRAPEDATDMNLNRRADVFSLGGLLYFMLTGTHPPPVAVGGAPQEMAQHLDLESVPRPLHTVLLTAMALPRQDRHDGAMRMARALYEATQLIPLEARTHAATPARPPEATAITDEVDQPRAEKTTVGQVITDEVDRPPPPRADPAQVITDEMDRPRVEPTVINAVPLLRPPSEDFGSTDTTLPMLRAEVIAAMRAQQPAPLSTTPSQIGLIAVPEPEPEPETARPLSATPSMVGLTPVSDPSPLSATPSMVGLTPVLDPADAGRFHDETPLEVRSPPARPSLLMCRSCGRRFADQSALAAHVGGCPGPSPEPQSPDAAVPEVSLRRAVADTRCRHCGTYFNTLSELETHLPRCSMKHQSFSSMSDDAELDLALPDPVLAALDEVSQRLHAVPNRALADMAQRGVEMLRDLAGVLADSRLPSDDTEPLKSRVVELARRLVTLAQDGQTGGQRQMNQHLDALVRTSIKVQDLTAGGVVPALTALESAVKSLEAAVPGRRAR